jgi:hypothetical protein
VIRKKNITPNRNKLNCNFIQKFLYCFIAFLHILNLQIIKKCYIVVLG